MAVVGREAEQERARRRVGRAPAPSQPKRLNKLLALA